MDTPTKLTRRLILGTVLAGGISLGALTPPLQAQEAKEDKMEHKAAGEVTKAIAIMVPTEGSKTQGTITFTKEGKGVRVSGEITGLTPGKHGFHIHEFGDRSAPDGTSAGGHFNPTDMPHAGPEADKHHVGDLGNVEADQSGTAKIDIVQEELSFEGKTSILGRGLVVHAKADDLKSQPSGDAGGRVAVGVIGVAKP